MPLDRIRQAGAKAAKSPGRVGSGANLSDDAFSTLPSFANDSPKVLILIRIFTGKSLKHFEGSFHKAHLSFTEILPCSNHLSGENSC